MRPMFQRFRELVECIDFNFDHAQVARIGLGAFQCERHGATASGDVIVLDQDGIIQAVAMCRASAVFRVQTIVADV